LKNLFAAFDAALRLLHPFMPFLTKSCGTNCRKGGLEIDCAE